MGLKQDDFKIPEEKLEELNAEIERVVAEYFTRNLDADPLDGMTVVFNFGFGLGR